MLNQNQIRTSTKLLRPENLVSKPSSELMQLLWFNEKKLEKALENDLLQKPRRKLSKWIRERRKFSLFILIAIVIVIPVSMYFGVTSGKIILSIPAMIAMLLIFVFALIIDRAHIDVYERNIETINIILKSRAELNQKTLDKKFTIGPKAFAAFETLKSLGEANFTVWIKEIRKMGTPIDDKTLRNYLKNELTKVVGVKQSSFASSSRKQKHAKVYYVK